MIFFNSLNLFWHTDKNFCFYAEVNFWDFVRNETSAQNISTLFRCTGWAWNCQIIFRFASIHGRACFILNTDIYIIFSSVIIYTKSFHIQFPICNPFLYRLQPCLFLYLAFFFLSINCNYHMKMKVVSPFPNFSFVNIIVCFRPKPFWISFIQTLSNSLKKKYVII